MTGEFDVIVIGAGPAGVASALRAADMGARTALVSRGHFGGMAAVDGPVPVRTLAHASRLLREARQLGHYGISVGEPALHYPDLLARVQEVVSDVRKHSAFRAQIDSLGVAVHEQTGNARFVGPHEIETESGLKLRGAQFILCVGGTSRRLPIPGFELTATHSDAWSLSSVPSSLLVIGGGATGVQVASIFHGLGSQVQLFQAGPRILPTEDEDISAAVAAAFRASGIQVFENFGSIDRFERSQSGIRMVYSKKGAQSSAEAALAVASVGWVANSKGLDLAAAGVVTNSRGFVQVDKTLRTSAAHVFAAGDITGQLMLVPQALQAGFVAGTNAVKDTALTFGGEVSPIGSFTDPEYAQVGLTETKARERFNVVTAVVPFDSMTRAIIDGRTEGFCKLIVDQSTSAILGCHVVGDRAVDIVQLAAVAMAANMSVEELARIPFSFPTYAGILARAAASITRNQSLRAA